MIYMGTKPINLPGTAAILNKSEPVEPSKARQNLMK